MGLCFLGSGEIGRLGHYAGVHASLAASKKDPYGARTSDVELKVLLDFCEVPVRSSLSSCAS